MTKKYTYDRFIRSTQSIIEKRDEKMMKDLEKFIQLSRKCDNTPYNTGPNTSIINDSLQVMVNSLQEDSFSEDQMLDFLANFAE